MVFGGVLSVAGVRLWVSGLGAAVASPESEGRRGRDGWVKGVWFDRLTMDGWDGRSGGCCWVPGRDAGMTGGRGSTGWS